MREGATALIWAASSGHASVVDVLVKSGARIDVRDLGHRTPMSAAAEGGHKDAISALSLAEDWEWYAARKRERAAQAAVSKVLINVAQVSAVSQVTHSSCLLMWHCLWWCACTCMMCPLQNTNQRDETKALHSPLTLLCYTYTP